MKKLKFSNSVTKNEATSSEEYKMYTQPLKRETKSIQKLEEYLITVSDLP